jgi:hypothetical protein
MDTFDRMVATFKRMGLSESAAKLAVARGQGTEQQVREAWRSGEAAAEASRMRESATAVPPIVEQTAVAARTHLSMSDGEARTFAAQLHEREVRRAGPAHAESYLRTFVEGLRAPRRVAR